MLKHVHAEHSREIHVRAMAMLMERQNAFALPHTGEKGPGENLLLGHSF